MGVHLTQVSLYKKKLKSANDWLVSDVGSFEHRGSSA